MLKLEIAIRYLRSRKSHSVVNLISLVVLFAISATVASTILVVSLQRGLIGYIDTLYRDFDSQIRITSSQGKYFTSDSLLTTTLDSEPRIGVVSRVLQGDVLLENRHGSQQMATLRGVDSLYSSVVGITGRITHGSYQLSHGDIDQLVLGQGLAFSLSVNPSLKQWLTLYAISSRSKILPLIPLAGLGSNISREQAQPSAIFTMDEETDSGYLFSSLDFAQRLFRRSSNEITALELSLDEGADPNRVKQSLEKALGDNYTVATRQEQRAALFRIMNIERWIIFAILTMICAIATLSLSGALIMMISEKKVQSRTLSQLGYSAVDVRQIFTIIGVVVTATGALLGIIIGSLLVWVQSTFSLLKLGGSTMLIDAYPVELSPLDLILTLLIALMLGGVISLITTRSVRFQ
ncbi:MAG: hypothetical protein R3Y19_02370 [Rikenellaceae bacterium]